MRERVQLGGEGRHGQSRAGGAGEWAQPGAKDFAKGWGSPSKNHRHVGAARAGVGEQTERSHCRLHHLLNKTFHLLAKAKSQT